MKRKVFNDVLRSQLIFLFFLNFNCNLVYAQFANAIKGDITIKSTGTTGVKELVKGKFYYTLSSELLVYSLTFPNHQVFVGSDTTIRIYKNGKLVNTQKTPNLGVSSVYHLALAQELKNFGLLKSGFTIEKVQKDGKKVITTWKPPSGLEKKLGQIIMLTEDKRLSGLVFKDLNGKIIKKQFFKKYVFLDGVTFPLEVLEITFSADNKPIYRQTEYKNVKVNDIVPGDLYRYP